MAKYRVLLMHYEDDSNAKNNNDVGKVKAEYEVDAATYAEAKVLADAQSPESEIGDVLFVTWSKNNTEVR